jgi:hypothetical protein
MRHGLDIYVGSEKEMHWMADTLGDLSLAIRHMTRVVYKDQDEPYAQVREHISQTGVRDAIFLQYSCAGGGANTRRAGVTPRRGSSRSAG